MTTDAAPAITLDDDGPAAEATFRPPDRRWYGAALAVALLGVVAAFGTADRALERQGELVGAFTELPTPEITDGVTVEIVAPGPHTVWAGSSCAGLCRPASVATHQAHLTLEVAGPADATVTPFAGDRSFAVAGTGEGRAVWTVRFEAAGTYEVRLVDDGELAAPGLWLGEGHGLPTHPVRDAVAVGAVALAVASGLVLTTVARRRRFYAAFAARQRLRAEVVEPSSTAAVEDLYDSVERWDAGTTSPAADPGPADDETFDSQLGVLTKRLERPDAEAPPAPPPAVTRVPAPPVPAGPTDPSADTPSVAPDPAPRAADVALDSQLGALTRRLGRGPLPGAVPGPGAPEAPAAAPAIDGHTTDASGDPPDPTAPSTAGDPSLDSTLGLLTRRLNRRAADPTPEPAATAPDDRVHAPAAAAAAPSADDRQLDTALGAMTRRLGRVPAPSAPAGAMVPVDPAPPAADTTTHAGEAGPTVPVPADDRFDSTLDVLARRLGRTTPSTWATGRPSEPSA